MNPQPSKKVLLSLYDLKVYFPVKKDKLFQKERLCVRAVDGIDLAIFEGETFGLVGESGCGKSTLGRSLLRLYDLTHGSVRYSGITFDEYAPKYMLHDLRKIRRIRRIKKQDTHYLIDHYMHTVLLAGALLLADDLLGVMKGLEGKYKFVSKIGKLSTIKKTLELNRIALSENNRLSKRDDKRLKTYDQKIQDLAKEIDQITRALAQINAKLDAIRRSCAGKRGYEQLEEYKDTSVDLSRLTDEEMRVLRKEMQVVFQDPYSSLNPRLTVGQLISEGLIAHNMYKRSTEQIERYIIKIMDKCGLQHYMIHRYPHQFSGGQRQRIGIARALALEPRFVVLDEAVSALDVSIQSQIINLLIDLKEQNKLTYLFISHDLSTVKFISDRIGIMYLGNIVELGDSNEIFLEPLHPYTEALLNAIPTTEDEANKPLQIIEGDVPSPIFPPSGCKFHTRCIYCREVCIEKKPEWQEVLPNHFVACHFPLSDKGSDE